MNNLLRRAFLAAMVACILPVPIAILAAALGVRSADDAAGWFGFAVAAVVSLIAIRGFVEEPFRLEFRRYLLRVLALAVRRGHSVGHGLLAVAEDFDGDRRRSVHAILGVLDEGKPLSEALAVGGRGYVPVHVVEAVRAAEGGGRLAETLEAAVEEGVAERPFRLHTLRAMAYPVVILAVIVFLSTYIVPQFGAICSQIVDGSGNPLELPGVTVLMLRIGAWISAVAPFTLLVLILLLPFRSRAARQRFRWLLDPLALRAPFFGPVFRLRVAERFCRILGGGVRAEMSLPDAMAQAGEAAGNRVAARRAEEAASAVRTGIPFDRAVSGLPFPLFVRARMAAASGGGPERFSEALAALAAECQWRRLRLVEASLASLQPVALLLCTGLVGVTWFGVMTVITRLQEALIPW